MEKRLYIKICIFCKKEFHPFNYKQKLCSNKCSGLWKTSYLRYKKICKYCLKEFTTTKHRNQVFCSRKCFIDFKSRNIKILNCIICGKARMVKLNEFKRGNPKYCSKKCQGIGLSQQYIGKNNPLRKMKNGKANRKVKMLKRRLKSLTPGGKND